MKQSFALLFVLFLIPTLACNISTSDGGGDTSALGTEVALQQTQVALQQTQVALQQSDTQNQPATQSTPTSQPASLSVSATQPPTAVATKPPAATATQPPAPTQPPAATATQPPPPPPTQPPPPPPTEPPPSGQLTAEQQNMILQFTRESAYSFIDAYWYGDAIYTEPYHAGIALQNIENDIADLNAQGLYVYYEYDEAGSFITNIKLTTEGLYIVDLCESWNATTYTLSNNDFVSTLGWAIYPQTMYIQDFGGQLRITDVVFHDDTSLCAP